MQLAERSCEVDGCVSYPPLPSSCIDDAHPSDKPSSSADAFNSSGISKTDQISVLDLDEPGPDGLFNVRQMQLVGYAGVAGDQSLRLHGFDAEVLDDQTLRFFLINHRVPVGAGGAPLDASKVGGNSTIEVFEAQRGSTALTFIKTVADPAIATPNKVAATGDGGFVLANDRSQKVGLRRQLDPLLGGGNLAYCDASSNCAIATGSGYVIPNGIVRGHDGLFYVPCTGEPRIRIFRLEPSDGRLVEVGQIDAGMPIDNLAVEASGDIYGAGLPKLWQTATTLGDPAKPIPASTVLQVRRVGDAYRVDKVLEDTAGELVGGVTVARHDEKTGRFFLGGQSLRACYYSSAKANLGVVNPFITVCDPL